MGVECIDQPCPGHLSEERIDTDLRFEGSLREADHPEGSAPGLRLIRVIEEDETAGAEIGVASVA